MAGLSNAKAYLKKYRKRTIWHRALTCMAAVVVFCTTYALVLPALTLEIPTTCGIEEHTHTAACYVDSGSPLLCEEAIKLHQHDDSCRDEAGELICGYADFVLHTHDESCYNADSALRCPLPEIKSYTVKQPKASGFLEGVFDDLFNAESTTGSALDYTPAEDAAQEEAEVEYEDVAITEPHIHDDSCYELEDGAISEVPVCGLLEVYVHTHTAECFADETLICGKEEHQHGEWCYETVDLEEVNAYACLIDENGDVIPPEELEEPSIEEQPGLVDAVQAKRPSRMNALQLGWPSLMLNTLQADESNLLTDGAQEPAEIDLAATYDENGTMEGIDFKQYITAATIQHKEGNAWKDLDNGSVIKKDEQIRLRLNYALPGYTLSSEKRSIVYQLPDTITFVNAESGKVLNAFGEEVGIYSVSTDGKIEITFNDKYVAQNEAGNQITGFIAANTQVSAIESEGNTIDIAFTDDLTVELRVEDPSQDKADISVTKEALEVNQDTGIVSYKVTVTSEHGTGSPVNLKDTMQSLKSNSSVTIVGPNNFSQTIMPAENGFEITLPQMQPNDTYTLTYTAELPQDAVVDGTAKNIVHVESTKENGGKIEDSSSVDTQFKQTYVSKSGVKDGDVIRWTVTVNAGKHDIGGWTLKDVFNNAEFKGPVTITDSNGNSQTITLPYTFSENANDTYTVTYETPADKPIGENQAKNRAELTPNNGPGASSGDQYINVGDGGNQNYNPISKQAESLMKNGNTATIQWNVTISAKDGDIAAPWYYTDKLTENDQYFTEEQIQAVESGVSAAIAGKWEYSFERICENEKIIGYKLSFSTPMKKGENLTFHYESTANLEDGSKELIFKNSAGINDKVWTSGSINYKPLVLKYDQNDPSNPNSNHNYYDKVMDENGTLKWGIVVTLPKNYQGGDLTVKENLPEGVTLTALTMHTDGTGTSYDIEISKDGVHKAGVTTEKDGQTVTITIPASLAEKPGLTEIRFSIQAQINDDFNWPQEDGRPVASFENEVEVLSKDGNTHGISSQTQTIIKDNSKPVLTKQGSAANGIIPYSITVNPDGLDLLKNSDELTLLDTILIDNKSVNATLDLVPDSLKVYKRNSDGTKGEQLAAEKVPYTLEITAEGDLYNPATQYILKILLPDKLPLVVEYQYKISSPDIGGWKGITNTAKLEGVNKTSAESKTTLSVQIVDSSAGAGVDGLNIIKVDADNYGITLSGAKFKLYQYKKDGETGGYEPVTDENGKAIIYTTDQDGRASLSGLVFNTAYYLEEIEAPGDYLISGKPYYFYLANSDKTTYPEIKPEDFSGEEYAGGELVYFPNESNMTTIQVEKRWFFSDGQEMTNTKGGSINFDLYQSESNERPINGITAKVRWKGYYYGNNFFDKGPEIVPLGTIVTIVFTADEGENKASAPTVVINGTAVTAEREGNTSNFTCQFTVTKDTDLEVNIKDDYIKNGTHDWNFKKPETSTSIPASAKKIGSYSISNKDGWRWAREQLPKIATKTDGSIVYYTYYVKETPVTNYETICENNGIVSGTITIKNIESDKPIYELPSTGGPGVRAYTTAGLLLMMAATVMLFYRKNTRRKEDSASS